MWLLSDVFTSTKISIFAMLGSWRGLIPINMLKNDKLSKIDHNINIQTQISNAKIKNILESISNWTTELRL